MTSALSRFLDVLGAMEKLRGHINQNTENSSNNGTGPRFTVTFTNGEGGLETRFTIDQNTTLTDPANFGPILAALVSKVASLRNSENQDTSVEIEVISESSGDQAARRTAFTIQRSTLSPNTETIAELSAADDRTAVNTAVRGIFNRLLRGLMNRAE